MVTGLYEETHGIVANQFYDPSSHQVIFDFSLKTLELSPSLSDFQWSILAFQLHRSKQLE